MRRTPSIALLALLLAIGGTLSSASVVEAEALALDWQAPAKCPDAEHVRARVLAMLAKSSAKMPAVSAQGSVESRGPRHYLSLRLDVNGQTAVRKLEAEDCDVLSETAAWLIAVAIDPNVAPPKTSPVPSKPEPAPPGGSDPKPEPAETAPLKPFEPTEPTTQAEPSSVPQQASGANDGGPRLLSQSPLSGPSPLRPRAFIADVLGGVWIAGLAGPMGSLGGRVSLNVHTIDVGLRFSHRFARDKELAEPAQVTFSADELALFGCRSWGEQVRAGPCLGLAGQRLRGAARGITTPLDTSLWWLGVNLGGELRVRLWRKLDAVLLAGLGLPLTARPVFQITGLGTVGEVNLVSGSVSLGAGVSLP